jgi:hypothetical protein
MYSTGITQKLLTRRSRGLSFETIFVMETAEVGVAATRQPLEPNALQNAGPQARMWPAAIIVRDPLSRNRAECRSSIVGA